MCFEHNEKQLQATGPGTIIAQLPNRACFAGECWTNMCTQREYAHEYVEKANDGKMDYNVLEECILSELQWEHTLDAELISAAVGFRKKPGQHGERFLYSSQCV